MLLKLLIVGAAGSAGAMARYLVAGWALRLGDRFPFGTLAVNVVGCLAIGLVMYLAEQRSAISENARLALAVGFLGGFTTFSAFGYETFAMLRERDAALALVNVAAGVVLCVAAVWAGWSAARLLWGA